MPSRSSINAPITGPYTGHHVAKSEGHYKEHLS
jgi:hypothetical protein